MRDPAKTDHDRELPPTERRATSPAAPPRADQSATLTGRIGRYEPRKVLGTGGMGRVLLGRTPTGRLVAIKQIHPAILVACAALLVMGWSACLALGTAFVRFTLVRR